MSEPKTIRVLGSGGDYEDHPNPKYTPPSSFAAPVGSVWVELKESLRGWRKAEMHHAAAVIQAAHPARLSQLQAAEDAALKRLRILVDREPWAEILNELTSNNNSTTSVVEPKSDKP